MNLLERFENMPAQDVGTFNSIFKHNPILGFPFDAEVEILGVGKDDTRLLKVNGTVISKDLTYKAPVKKTKAIKKEKLERAELQNGVLPDIYRLKPAEFMIYCAVRDLGYVVGITELAKKINISQRTILTNLPQLVKLGLLSKQKVVTDNGCYFKIIAN